MARKLDQLLDVDDVRHTAASAIADVFGLRFEALSRGDAARWRAIAPRRGPPSTGGDGDPGSGLVPMQSSLPVAERRAVPTG